MTKPRVLNRLGVDTFDVVRLISYNIEYCEGISHGPLDYLKASHYLRSPPGLDEKMASYLSRRDPDIVGLVEVDAGSVRARRKDETAVFAEALGFDTVVKTNKYDSSDYWHQILRSLPLFKYQDNALLTGLSVDGATYHTLSRGMKNVAIQLDLAEPEPHTVLLVHLALFEHARTQQLRDIKNILGGIDQPLLVCGDFNTFNDDEIKAFLEDTRLHDAYEEVGVSSPETAPTWNPTHRLDNILHTPAISVHSYNVLDAEFSDHLPVELDYSVSAK